MRRVIISLVIVAATMIGGCAVNGPKNNDPRYGDGSLPVEERQPLEEFISDVEPGVVKFMRALDSAGANLYLSRGGESELKSCGYPVFGYQIRGPMAFGKAIAENTLLELYGQLVKPLGFDHTYRRADEVNTTYTWFNRRDGGYVTTVLFPDGSLVVDYVSGCRPYHGEGKPEHVRTSWEQKLIARQPPTPDPSESPSPSETPLN
ncbi:DUF4853 domain-containing protein [Buchananella hordeovulneris]|uniref:DUF4853 domain-containing protein n=1 Tax=Buchananella hordeovulneris TaxID=52770 RepID=UPI000A035943|nr:DUF4853 domain-containing protein [Buchananella hordeovulneris]RRD50854.1 DUF4853 domain-containing protein [Buchananella hordeovulneris]